jgi:uncharacterized protein (TIGR03067 family)
LEGTWIGERQEMEGQVRRLGEGESRLTFVGRKLLAVGLVGPKEAELSFVVDTKVSPRQLKYTLPPTTTITAIYKIEGDTLTIGVRTPGHQLPTTFSSEPGSGAMLLVLKRQKGKALVHLTVIASRRYIPRP